MEPMEIRYEPGIGFEEEFFRLILENLRDYAVFALDADGTVLSWNPGAELLLGYAEHEILGQSSFIIFTPEDQKDGIPRRELEKALLEGRADDERWHVKKDGSRFFASGVLFSLIDEQGMTRGLCKILRDITARVVHEENLQAEYDQLTALRQILLESDMRLMTMAEAVEDLALFFLDPKGRVMTWNRGAERLTGFRESEILGKTFADFHPPGEDPSAAPQALALAGEAGRSERTGWRIRKDGTRYWGDEILTALRDESGGLLGYLEILRDITERRETEEALRRSEEQLRQSQKMEAIGRLAGGVAHDFNNLLTGITGYTELGLAMVDEGSPLANILQEVLKAGHTAADLTRRLLALSRKQPLSPSVLDLNEVVQSMTAMLRRLIGEDIGLSTYLAVDTGKVKADRGLLEQVLLNLAVNAKDAMPQGGSLTIETRAMDLDAMFITSQVRLEPGRYAMLVVTDTGTGMDQTVKSHLFEPFFTTKEKGRGTGLGLSTVYGIVRQSGGEISVVSEPGRGSSFIIYLPRVESPEGKTETRPQVRSAPKASGETILVAEDEDTVRHLVRNILEKSGFRVVDVSSGEMALKIWDGKEDAIDLLLTNVVMPGMNGRELADKLRMRKRDLKVVYMSGYTADVHLKERESEDGFYFLSKPFSPNELQAVVGNALNGFHPVHHGQ
jgi:PAS domain S-box-containing protein